MLIAQGAKDPRVVKSESDQMVEAMRKRGVEVEYEAMERFLGKHIGAAGA